jgi:indolepyruvate ferredoxin oxidoreductase, alpha subunit
MDLNQLVNGKSGDKEFLLGNEAAVRGAIEAGVSIAATYPGTPSSEIGNILSILAKDAGMFFEFSINEKVAMEVAAASSASGLKSFTFMKHVGLNVASDSFLTAVYTGTPGGMVVLSADDPSMFSSQNEQDNRHYARLANCPLLEPSNPQEVKDMMKYGYEISKKFSIPVLLRTTTRVSHMRGIVKFDDVKKVSEEKTRTEDVHWKKGFFKKNPKKFVPVPENSMVMHEELVFKMENIEELTNNSDLNSIFDFYSNNSNVSSKKYGVITSGSAFNYAYDVINEDNLPYDILKLGFSYPFPKDFILDFVEDLDGIFVVEEVDPIMEKEVLATIGEIGLDIPVFGKLDETFPLIHEFNCDIVRNSFNKVINRDNIGSNNGDDEITNNESSKLDISQKLSALKNNLPSRPPTLCAGCSHRATYFGVRRAAEELNITNENLIFSSDIGCYTLGVSPPYETTDYLLSMGSSIGDACGFSVGTDQYIISFIGDSTFFHGGIPPLVNGVHNKHRFVVTILDNRTTAMTGGQPNPGLPIDGMGNVAPEISIEKIAKAAGCEFVETINPMNLNKTIDTYKRALSYDGVAVIIAKYPCTLIKGIKSKKPMAIKEDKCNNCRICVDTLACPAISVFDDKVTIDSLLCKGCTVCVQMCDEKAIGIKKDL